ncbi:hypothetical protein Tco_1011024 [Tanacetum coccineum]
MTITLMSVSTTLDVTSVVAFLMKQLTALRSLPLTKGNQGLLVSDPLNPLKSGSQKKLICFKMYVHDYLKRSVWYLNSGCSRHMTGVKQYLHKYSKESGPKVVFEDNSSGTIFNQNNEVVPVAPRRRDVYVIDLSSYNEERNACFFAKASNSANWLWYKRLSHPITGGSPPPRGLDRNT